MTSQSTQTARDLVPAGVEDLELTARLIVEGLRAGRHRSPFHGFSAEFSQYRQYRSGDDLKHLDWKVLARTDRLYTRQFREATSMGVMLVVDASASMDFPEGAGSKLRYAARVAAALAYLVTQQGDAVGLITSAGGRAEFLPVKGGRLHLRALLSRLATLAGRGAWSPADVITRAAERLKRRGVLFVLSDLYDADADARRAMRLAARRGHDVTLLQVLSPDELHFVDRGDVEFEDAETGTRRVVSAATAAPAYRRRVADFLEGTRRDALRDGVDHALLRTNVPPVDSLRAYLLRR